MRLLRAVAVLCVAAAIALGAAVVDAATFRHHVTIKGSYGLYDFKPKTITIKKGQTVHWSWDSDQRHNVHFSKDRHSKTAKKVTDYKRTFNRVATFRYSCTVHAFYGKVVVEKP